MPPIIEPAKLRRFVMRPNTCGDGCGAIETPNWAKLSEIPDYSKLLGDAAMRERVNRVKHLSEPSVLSSPTVSFTDPSRESPKLIHEIKTLRKTADEHARAMKPATAGSEAKKLEIEHLKATVEQSKKSSASDSCCNDCTQTPILGWNNLKSSSTGS